MKWKVFVGLIIGLLLLSGCSLFEDEKDPLEEFEHYNLDGDNERIYYQYIDSNYNYQTYRFANITNGGNTPLYGLFLQVKGNDYILLDKIETCGVPHYRFYENKLYITYCIDKYSEYTLDGINTEKVDLSDKFEYGFPISKIDAVNDDYIYFIGSGPSYRHEDKDEEIVKCSLKNYQCEIVAN